MAKNIIQSDEYLNDLEIEQVKIFNSNQVMKEAVRKILLAEIYYNATLKAGEPAQPYRNAVLGFLLTEDGNIRSVNDEQLGREVRGFAEGISMVQRGFAKLAKYSEKAVEEVEDSENPAV